MTGWVILLAILGILILVLFLRIGGIIKYDEGVLRVTLIAGPFRVSVLPAKGKKSKKKPPKEMHEEGEKAPESKLKGNGARLLEALPVVAEAAGALKRKIRIDRLDVRILWGGADPAAAAIGYGAANGVLGMIWPLFDHNFKVRDHAFQVALDYDRREPMISADLAVTASIGQSLAFIIRYGLKLISIWSRGRKAPRDNRRENHE